MKNNKLKSCSLKLSEKNCPALDFFSILKTTILQKMWSNRPPSQKSGRQISNWERFHNKLVYC